MVLPRWTVRSRGQDRCRVVGGAPGSFRSAMRGVGCCTLLPPSVRSNMRRNMSSGRRWGCPPGDRGWPAADATDRGRPIPRRCRSRGDTRLRTSATTTAARQNDVVEAVPAVHKPLSREGSRCRRQRTVPGEDNCQAITVLDHSLQVGYSPGAWARRGQPYAGVLTSFAAEVFRGGRLPRDPDRTASGPTGSGGGSQRVAGTRARAHCRNP